MSNHLKNESSPYLLQHADNPVDWYPWCEEAFERARKEDKPIFLSIGYSTCHWCHVMAHESFENPDTAKILNDNYISIKVDREERPDIDSVYMAVCQAMTGSGGWPMSIFMTWDRKPFFAGTYFPIESRYGMPGFSVVLMEIARQWSSNKNELFKTADYITERLKAAEDDNVNERRRASEENNVSEKLKTSRTDALDRQTKVKETDYTMESANYNRNDRHLISEAVRTFTNSFDAVNGGFDPAPKFPAPHNLLFLMLYAKQNRDTEALNMAERTLIQMRKGGIFDQIGFGFSRYSTDRYFLAPHFEKMLYDNALLIMAYSSMYVLTCDKAKKHIYLDTAVKTAEYILREMTSLNGGFFSAQDADSEGVEGRYYTFTLDEIKKVLGTENGGRFAKAFDITNEGNFEGVNIPNLLKSNDLDSDYSEELHKLYDYRKNRTRLHLDDKILLSWNSMMIAALAILYRVSKNEEYLAAAKNAQTFIEENLTDGMKLYTSVRESNEPETDKASDKESNKGFDKASDEKADSKASSYKRSEKAFLDDYAFYMAALIELYNSTLEDRYLKLARDYCMETVGRFYDSEKSGFYLAKVNDTELFMNPKETYDGAIPSGNSVMAYNLVRLYHLTEDEAYQKMAEEQMDYMSGKAEMYPAGHCMFLIAKQLYDYPPEHITVVVKEESGLAQLKGHLSLLSNILVVSENDEYPLLNGKTTYYVCRDGMCLPPENEI